MKFNATKALVANRGRPPDSFLIELVAWGKTAAPEIFAVNALTDIYSFVKPQLGPWQGVSHRRAVMLEVLRVLAGFESSWNWNEGRDVTNPSSGTACTEEAGIFQCSGNSMSFDPSLPALFQSHKGVWDSHHMATTCRNFIELTKKDHVFAIEYCARLLRFTTSHHGPVKRKEINRWLSHAAVEEFLVLLGMS